MSHEGNAWTTGAIITVTAMVLAIALIGGLVVLGGQDWLVPGRTPPEIAVPDVDDENFGLAEYVDRKLVLDSEGRLSIDGNEYSDAELRQYLTRLREDGGVQVALHVDSDGPSHRRIAVEKICEEVTGLKPETSFAVEVTSPLDEKEGESGAPGLESDLAP